MTTREKNQPIGECPCPAKGCDLIAQVFRYRGRPNERQRRKAGKLYCVCPQDGTFSEAAGGRMQEFILENATIWPEGTRPASAAPADDSSAKPQSKTTPAPAPSSAAPVQQSGQPPPSKRPDLWDL